MEQKYIQAAIDYKKNIAGYHHPHKDDEYTVLSELDHTLAYIHHLVQTLHRRYPHEYKSDTQRYAEAEINNKQ